MAWLGGDQEHALDLYRSVLGGFSLSEEAPNNLFELKTMIQGQPVDCRTPRDRRIESESGGVDRGSGWSAGGSAENESAARLFGLADWVANDGQVRIWPPPDEPDYANQVAAVREALGAGCVRATMEGESLSIEQAPALALPQRM